MGCRAAAASLQVKSPGAQVEKPGHGIGTSTDCTYDVLRPEKLLADLL
jgi:hypothetical protein